MTKQSEKIAHKQPKKKQFRYFDSYISKLLKIGQPEKGITANARQQFNSVLVYITEILADKAISVALRSNKKTVSAEEIGTAARLVFDGEFLANALDSVDKAVEMYQKSAKQGSKQARAGLVFPPSVTEKFIRKFGVSKMMVTQTAPIVLSAIVEQLATRLLVDAGSKAQESKKVRLTVRNFELAVREDEEMNNFFLRYNIHFIGGGSVPFIHPTLKKKKPRRRKVVLEGEENTTKAHRFKPGTVALRNIKKMQKVSNQLVLAKAPFEKVVRQCFRCDEPPKVAKQVFLLIQYCVEARIVDLLKQSTLAAIHGNRVKVLPEDIDFIMAIKEGRTPLMVEVMDKEAADTEESEKSEFDPLLEGLTKPSLQRLARQAGVKTMANECVGVIRKFVVADLNKICRDVLILNQQRKTKTVMLEDVMNALVEQGDRVAKSDQLGSKTCAAH